MTAAGGRAAERHDYSRMKLELVDSSGTKKRPVEAIETGDSLSIGVRGLSPGAPVEVYLHDDQGKEWSYARRYADRRGNIEASLFWFHSGVIGTTSRKIRLRPDPAFTTFEEAEAYFAKHRLVLTVRDLEGRTVGKRTLPVQKRQTPMLYPSSKDGILMNSFHAQREDIYVTGNHFPAGSTVHLFLVPNQYVWNVGDGLFDRSGRAGGAKAQTVQLSPRQTRFTVKVWDRADARRGTFDIVGRVGKEVGKPVLAPTDILSYAEDTAIICYEIINGHVVIDSAGRMRSGPAYFEFSDAFEKQEHVYAAVDPTDVPPSHPGGSYAAYYIGKSVV